CDLTYTVKKGDTCSAIEAHTGISDAQLHALNPSINRACTNLQIGQILCISRVVVVICVEIYIVVAGDTCATIEAKTGVSDSQLHAYNPSINSGCTSMFP
ncbi:hypothetical protein DFH09DRAFT_846125, partial [Mycena vulgaris]